MTNVNRLLENPMEATTIVENFVLLLVEHVVRKKRKKGGNAAYNFSIIASHKPGKCRVIFYWVT